MCIRLNRISNLKIYLKPRPKSEKLANTRKEEMEKKVAESSLFISLQELRMQQTSSAPIVKADLRRTSISLLISMIYLPRHFEVLFV
jgi:hypothetical protein